MVSLKIVVKSGGKWHRAIYTNDSTGVQVAVLVREPQGDKVRLSIPIEGMGGWAVTLPSPQLATKVAHREVSMVGRLYNRIVFLPWAFIRHELR
jgi:hypothetical protein